MSLRSGLLAEYHFTGNANDSSGNGNNGTVSGATLTTDKNSVASQAYNFNGTNSYITFGNVANITTNDFSVSFWVKRTAFTQYAGLVSKRDWSVGTNVGWDIIQGTTSSQLYLKLYDGTTSFATDVSVDIGIGVWNYVTVVWKRNSNVEVYLNNTLKTTNSISAVSGSLTNTQSLEFGRSTGIGGGFKYSNVVLDEVKIYDRALTQYEITQLYYGYDTTFNQFGVLRSGLINEWQFTGNTTDSVGSNNFTNNGSAPLTTDKNSVSNQAYSFNGTSQYFSTSSISQISKSLPYSVSVWFKQNTTTGVRTIYQNTPATNNYNGLQMNGTTLTAGIYNGSSYFAQKNGTVSDTNWHHAVVTFDGTSTLKLYIDGIEQTSTGTNPQLDTTNAFYVGARTGATKQYWNGNLDEVKIYNRSLTDTEVKMLYYGYDTTATSFEILNQGLETLWHFTGDDTDSSGNGHTLTNNGTLLTTDKNGVSSQAYDYSGTAQYKTTTSLTSWLNTFDTQDKSWCYWINLGTKSTVDTVSFMSDSDVNPRINLGDFAGTSGNTFRFEVRDDVGNYVLINDTGTISTGTWYLINGTWDSVSKTLTMYKNGVQINTATNGSIGTISQFTTTEPFTIGGRNTAGTIAHEFDGKIDEFRLMNRKWTEDEVIELYYNYDIPTMAEDSSSSGYSKKVNGITPGKVNGITAANIGKVNGI